MMHAPPISPSLSIPGLMCPNPGPIPECAQSGQLPLPPCNLATWFFSAGKGSGILW